MGDEVRIDEVLRAARVRWPPSAYTRGRLRYFDLRWYGEVGWAGTITSLGSWPEMSPALRAIQATLDQRRDALRDRLHQAGRVDIAEAEWEPTTIVVEGRPDHDHLPWTLVDIASAVDEDPRKLNQWPSLPPCDLRSPQQGARLWWPSTVVDWCEREGIAYDVARVYAVEAVD